MWVSPMDFAKSSPPMSYSLFCCCCYSSGICYTFWCCQLDTWLSAPVRYLPAALISRPHFKKEIKRLSSGIQFIAKKHGHNKEIIHQMHISLLFVLNWYTYTTTLSGWYCLQHSLMWKIHLCTETDSPLGRRLHSGHHFNLYNVLCVTDSDFVMTIVIQVCSPL